MIEGNVFWDEIVSIEEAQNETVYDLTVDDTHNFFANGLLVHNCGEIPLSPYDSCRLMVLNLTSFVTNPFTADARFDFARFHEVAMKAQRLMDDLVDLEVECVDRIIKKIVSDGESSRVKETERDLWQKIRAAGLNGRRTGLGITGLGDCLAALDVTYGSEESIEWTEKIYKALAIAAHTSSCILAKERGPFPIFDWKEEKDHPYLNKIMKYCSPEVEKMWKETGRRNIALTTTAPVGSVSCLTRTTSGIEPAFLLSYKRRRKVTPGDFTAKVDFVDDMGDKWAEYTVYHHWFKKWMDVTGLENVEDSPYNGATANDVNWVASVDLQAAAQRWIDHSISKTCNLPNSASRELVSEVYMRAWESGCKGFTVYRDGCRTGVLVSNDTPKSDEKKSGDRHAKKRTKELPCDIHRINVRNGDTNESWMVLIGLMDGKPYEVFCGLAGNIEAPKKHKSGMLVKNGKRDGNATYNLVIPVGDDDELIFKDVVELFANPTQGAFSRTISLALRHEVPIQYVVEQLQKDKSSDMFSFAKTISRVLKGYIKDGTTVAGRKYQSCGSENLVYQEGCMACVSCGSSKCGQHNFKL